MARKAQARRTPVSTGVTPAPTTPTGWAAVQCWLRSNENAVWLTCGWVTLVIITGLAIGNYWWGKVFSVVGLATIAGFTLFGYMTEKDKPFRYKLAIIGIWILVGISAWHLLSEEMQEKIKANVGGAFKSSQTSSEASPPAPSEFEVEAPVGRWSDWFSTLHGEIIDSHGPILLMVDNGEGQVQVVARDDISVKPEMAPVMESARARVRSRTTEAVKVTVSR